MKSSLTGSSTCRFLTICFAGALTMLTIATMPGVRAAVPTQSAADEPSVAIVEISPAEVEGEVGEEIVFQALAKDETGAPMDLEPSTWFAAPCLPIRKQRRPNSRARVGLAKHGRARRRGPESTQG
jgi:hypothetical protein